MADLSMRTLFERYSPAVRMVEALDSSGDKTCGTAFHLGRGVWATARHVLEDTAQPRLIIGNGDPVGIGEWFGAPDADVAIFTTSTERPRHVVPLGGHLDDWIRDEDFYLAPVLLMGYPRVPLSQGRALVAVTGEVNAVIDRIDDRHVQFIVSPLARGGFSGGPAICGWDFALGVVSQELSEDVTAPGFTAVVSVEPLWSLLAAHDLTPAEQDALR